MARRRLHDVGVTEPLLRAIAERMQLSTADTLLDAGCGDGYYLGSLARESGCSAHGVDISVAAIDAAARRYPGAEWIVANADRFLPFPNGCFSGVISITARMNPSEFRRVLGENGRLLVAVPAPDDLVELRGAGRDRATRTTEEFAPHFTFLRQSRAHTTVDLEADQVRDLLLSTYRPPREKPQSGMRVTLSLDLLEFRPAS